MEGWKNERLAGAEKTLMLESIFAMPVPSPYARYMRVFAYVKKPAALALVLCLVFSASVAYASQAALPGDTLYALKTRVVEPLIGIAAFAPKQKLEWEQEKVVRRITEAKALAEKNELDEERVKEFEEKIEKGSTKFGVAATEVSKKAATTSEKQAEKREELKRDFRASLEVGKKQEGGNGDKIERLKDRAVKALEKSGQEGKNKK